MSKSNPSFSDLEIVDNQYSDRQYNISISIPEFTCVCPRTGHPDFATINIDYIPSLHIVELKSLKLYLQKFRNIGVFHEAVTNQILDDFKSACNPKSLMVVGRFNARGGISTVVESSWKE